MAPIRPLHHDAEDYPARLLDLPDPPPTVWVRGRVSATGPVVAIVGTRRADADGLGFAVSLAAELGGRGVSILSGGADGIDDAAHRGALESGGHTVVVQASPLDRPYPKASAPFFDTVVRRGGGCLSQTPPGAPLARWRFLSRNRLIAALADLVVVIQAPGRSGALSTARAAQRLGRPLLAVPAAPWDPRGEGNLRLLAEGVDRCRDVSDVLRRLPFSPRRSGIGSIGSQAPEAGSADGVRIDREQRRVLSALGGRPRPVDELAMRSELPPRRVRALLVELSLAGRVEQRAAGWRLTDAPRGLKRSLSGSSRSET